MPSIFALLLCLTLDVSLPASAETARVSFILVNDIYQISEQIMPDGNARGGFARLAAVVKAERAKGPVIFAHGGDTLSPSILSGIDHGEHMIALTNAVRPDIFAPGNHEYDFGKAVFLQRMAEAKFPVFAANLRGPDGQPLPNIKDRAIVTIDGVKIGLVGATFDDSDHASSPEDLKFLPTVETVRAQAETLRREGADFVVAVMHADRQQTSDLVASHTVDLVLTGHSHDLLVNYDGRTAVMESSFDAHYTTIADIEINVSGDAGQRRTSWWPQFRVIDSATVTPDPEVAALVSSYNDTFSRELDAPLATTTVELDSRTPTVRGGEAAIGNVIADAIRSTIGADIAIMNGGGIRGGRLYPAGFALTRRDVLAELPFGNRVVEVTISGAALRQALENGLGSYPQVTGRYPQLSGLTIEADAKQPPGQRIVAVRVGTAPLDDQKNYTVAVPDFIARGGDGYVQFKDAPRTLADNDAPLLAAEVMSYLRDLGRLQTAIEGRIAWRN